jgi:hypothetical protein
MQRVPLLFACCVLLPCSLPAAGPATKPVAFDTPGGYFVSNPFEPAAPRSCVVIKDQQTFDKGDFTVVRFAKSGKKIKRIEVDLHR